MKKIITLCILALVAIPSYAATLNSLSNEQIIQYLTNKTLTLVPLVTKNGQLINNSIFVYFGKDKVVGKFATPMESEQQMDEGSWNVSPDGLLCVTWQHWYAQHAICAYVYDFNNSVIFIDQQKNKARLMSFKINDDIGNKISEEIISNTDNESENKNQ